MKHKLKANPCENINGRTVRPYILDDEIICYLDIENVFKDEEKNQVIEISKLLFAINKKLNTVYKLSDLKTFIHTGIVDDNI